MTRQRMVTLSPEAHKQREEMLAAEAKRLIAARLALDGGQANKRWLEGTPSPEAMKAASASRDRDYTLQVVNELRRRLAAKDRNGKD